jgi:hypothetical protein
MGRGGIKMTYLITTTAGFNWIPWKLANAAGALAGVFWMQVGTGTAAPSASNNSLQAPTSEARVQVNTVVSYSNVLEFWAEMTFNGSKTIAEVGLFDASSGGNMYFVGTLNPTQAVVSGDKIDFALYTSFGQG